MSIAKFVAATMAAGAASLVLGVKGAQAVEVAITDMDALFGNPAEIKSLAKSAGGSDLIDSLLAAVGKFQDYQYTSDMFTRKSKGWKEYAGAQIEWKYKNLFRAKITSDDYRNGSVVVRQASGKIRGSGGSGLSMLKMTLQADSRTLKLPTGYSLANSDFYSLYDSMKRYLPNGEVLVSPSAVKVKPFEQPVLVVILKSVAGDDSPLSEVIYIDPKLKTPLVWGTYKDGAASASVIFEHLLPNIGLKEDVFTL